MSKTPPEEVTEPAEPVWPNPAISTPFLSELKKVNRGDYYSSEQVYALIKAYNNLYSVTSPAPSQLTAASEATAAQQEPVAWMWKYVGKDPIGAQIKPCARAFHEMDPRNPPYPDFWKPIYPLFADPANGEDTK